MYVFGTCYQNYFCHFLKAFSRGKEQQMLKYWQNQYFLCRPAFSDHVFICQTLEGFKSLMEK